MKRGFHMIEFSSAKTRLLILKVMRLIALVTMFYNAFISFRTDVYLLIELIGLIIIIGVNDYIREKFVKNHKSKWYYLSFILSNAVASYFSYKANGTGIEIYNVILIIDLVLFNEKTPISLLILNFIAFALPYKINVNIAGVVSLQEIFLKYLNIIVIVYIIKSVITEKSRTEKLNKELKTANSKLKDYSERIEELTISKERTRIAQELHDSIGHSLIALRMNLEFAENVVDLKPEKAKEVINKSHNISKECITKLREVVSVLKEDSTIKNLRKGINELFDNFKNNERYTFKLDMDEKIEKDSPNIKSCIYKTVMEGITNGIKHGNANTFSIEIKRLQDTIHLIVSNDGVGCSEIKKSNGISGIDKRITELGGSVRFYSENNIGFIIEGFIPVRR